MRDTKDAQEPTGDVQEFLSLLAAWNGTGWDRIYNNHEVSVLASALRSANGNTADFTNPNAKGLHLVLDVTAFAGTSPTLEIIIDGKDPESGKYYEILSSGAIAGAVATTVLRVHPSLVEVANSIARDLLPRTWRVRWVIGGTAGPSFTFSLGAVLFP